MLVFLPGQDDIESLQLLLEEHLPHVRSKLSSKGLPKGSVISETSTSAAVSSKLAPVDSTMDAVGDNAINNKATNNTPEPSSTVTTPAAGTCTDAEDDISSAAHHTVSLLQDFEVMALYAAMPPDEQLKVFAPMRPGVRRFILSTNIAETSVTISGIKYGKCIIAR